MHARQHVRDAFVQLLEGAEAAVAPDDTDMTSIDRVRDGLAALSNTDTGLLSDSEWAQVVQFVGADVPERFLVDSKKLFEGICMAVLSEEDVPAEVLLGEVALTNQEALDLVCEDLVKMIQEEARQEDGETAGCMTLTLCC
jgi:hypothetical protein